MPVDNSYRITLQGGRWGHLRPQNNRLISGNYSGNVLVGPPGSEKPVCDDNWNLINADVACKQVTRPMSNHPSCQLGWAGAVTMTKESRFGTHGSVFAMDQVIPL